MNRRTKVALLATGTIVGVMAAALWVGLNPFAPDDGKSEADPGKVSSAATAAAAAAESSVATPADEEIDAIQADLASGAEDKIAPYISSDTGQALNQSFVEGLEALGLQFDYSTLTPLSTSGAWSVRAKDSRGSTWDVGILRDPDGKLRIVYTEKSK